jgi:hypothetical protein
MGHGDVRELPRPTTLIPSWTSNTYQIGSIDQALNPILIAASCSALALGTEAMA